MNGMAMMRLSLAVLAAMAALGLAAWFALPPGAQLPVHWNAAGEADRHATAGVALAMPVLAGAGMVLLMALLPRIEPLQRHMAESAPFYRAVWLAMLALCALIELMVALPAFGLSLPAMVVPVAIGILFIIMGNLLPKTRPSFFVGIRTPWTLADRENWIATHRLGGRTMMAGGCLILLAAFMPAPLIAPMLLAAVALAVVPPILYSYLYWRWHRTH